MKIQRDFCPVCGFPDFDPLDDLGYTTYEICPSCGAQSGYTYDTEPDEKHLEAVRENWFVEEKGRWWSTTTKPPKEWNAKIQLESAGLPVPK